MRVLLVGVSTRAAAASAARVGFRVTALDAFGDLDQHRRVRSLSLPRDLGVRFGALEAARAARAIDCDAVAYTAGLENSPRAVRLLAEERALWGNTPATLRRVRDPVLLARVLARRGFAVPRTLGGQAGRWADGQMSRWAGQRGGGAVGRRGSVCDPRATGAGARARWLVKPRASGGGHGIGPWRGDSPLAAGFVLQEYIVGTPGSVVFAAATGAAEPPARPPARPPAGSSRVVVLGLSRQLVGERAFGARGFRYCGSILAGAGDAQFEADAELLECAAALAHAAAEEFGLMGVNGIDFVARSGVPYPVEVNPRYSASMELVERAYGLSVFGVHVRACLGELPRFDVATARQDRGAVGKAVVYARRTVTMGDTRAWLRDRNVRDVPRPGERIPRGRPICTVFARGRDARSCYAALVRRAERVYCEVERYSERRKIA